MRRIFWGFCRNWVLIDPLHYLSSRSAYGFEFAEIFVIKKRLPDSPSRGVSESGSRWLIDSPSRGVGFWMFKSKTWQVGESSTPWLAESGSRHGESGSRYSIFLKFSIDFPDFKRLNQPFKRSIWQKRSQPCNVLSPLIYLKVWKKLYL